MDFIEYLQEVDGNQPPFSLGRFLTVYMVYSVILDADGKWCVLWCITRNGSSYKDGTMKSSDM